MDRSQLSLFNQDIGRRILEFRESITPGFNTPEDIVPRHILDEETHRLSSAIAELENLCRGGDLGDSCSILESLRREPSIFEVIRLILALPKKGIVFNNGLALTGELPSRVDELEQLVDLLNEVGLWELFGSSPDIEKLVHVALIADYARRRPYRVRRNVEERFRRILHYSLKETSQRLSQEFELISPRELSRATTILETWQSPSFRRGVDYFVAAQGQPVAAVGFVFITGVGGSQLRDFRALYPDLQRELSRMSVQLILIADGQGFMDLSGSVLQDLFSSVYTVISLNQAERGELTQALVRAATERVPKLTPLDRIIESTLNAGEGVLAEVLPVSSNQAHLALAQFVNESPHLALILSSRGESIHWEREDLVKRGFELTDEFEIRKALQLFFDLMDAPLSEMVELESTESAKMAVISIRTDSIIPKGFLVVGSTQEPTFELLKAVARQSLQVVPEAKLAVLIVPQRNPSMAWSERRSLQSILSANVVTMDSDTLLEFAKNKMSPRAGFTTLVLEQSDLTKITPFVVNSATPQRMYFGREREEATLLSALSTSSVALLGSRRIGKTSLMLRVKESLNDANFLAYFGDCQTVKNWLDFGHIARRQWGVILPDQFQPRHLFELIEQLGSEIEKNIVILLDEIDQLLDWDTSHQEDQVPEAFFRACRTISQEGKAQFVFSGERTIAGKLWDPHSPHWNFCRALPLQQLDRESTEKLIVQPLEALQIQIPDIASFQEMIWTLTSGHPQIAQYLGDKLIQLLNQRKPENRGYISGKDFHEVADSYEFKEHYVTTYWGQATPLEKLISLLVVDGVSSPSEMINEFQKADLADPESEVLDALKMLDLYGILQQDRSTYELRAVWFKSALAVFGDLGQMIKRYWEKI